MCFGLYQGRLGAWLTFRLNSGNSHETGRVNLQQSHGTRGTSILYAVPAKAGS
jgi:hypothetical protein